LDSAENLTLLPIDLTKQSVFDVLRGTAFSFDIATLFIAEGITMYLHKNEIERFFHQIQSCGRHDNSLLLFTYMNKQPSGSIQFESATRFVDHWLSLKKEVFKWGIATGELAGFLSAIGYRLVSVFDADYLTQQYLADKNINIPLARGENICVARIKC
jgi:O-methyltransferase involved in polyketide biosynthesis